MESLITKMKKVKKLISMLLLSVMVYLYFHNAENDMERTGIITFKQIEIQDILFRPVHNVSCRLKSAKLQCNNGSLYFNNIENIQNLTKTCPILKERKVMKHYEK